MTEQQLTEKLYKMADFQLEELIVMFNTKQIIQEAQINALLSLVKTMAKVFVGEDQTQELMKGFKVAVKSEIERLKADNPIHTQIAIDEFLNGLKDKGIDLLK